MKKQLYNILTPGDIVSLTGCGRTTANEWIEKHGIYRKASGGKGVIIATTKSLLPVINTYRVKKNQPIIDINGVIRILKGIDNEE